MGRKRMVIFPLYEEVRRITATLSNEQMGKVIRRALDAYYGGESVADDDGMVQLATTMLLEQAGRYKRTIIASSGAALFFFAISVVCEMWHFEHYAFVQNYCIGIACSLVVVVITSQLQYKHEHNKLLAEYCTAVREMISVLGQAFCGYEDSQISEQLPGNADAPPNTGTAGGLGFLLGSCRTFQTCQTCHHSFPSNR